MGDGSSAVTKQIWGVDLTGALKAFGIPDTQIPAKLEGMTFGADVITAGVVYHTL